MDKATITLTDNAVNHIQTYLKDKVDSTGLRLAVKPTGCSGYQYIVNMAEKVNEKDITVNTRGINIIIDDQSFRYLNGTELDYVREGLNEGFRFKNPNVAETCGCGESFSMKEPVEQD